MTSPGKRILRIAPLLLALCSFVAPGAPAAGATRVDGQALADPGLPSQWLGHGRNYSEQRFSPLTQIHAGNVSRLGLAWSLDLDDARSLQATPLAVDGVLYFTTGWSVVYAVDGVSGKVLWKYDPRSRERMADQPHRLKIAWGTHRGVAFWMGKVYVGTTDGRLVALSARNGRELWSVQTFDPKENRYITGAPRVFNGKVLIGHGGADVGPIRGYVTAYSADTGQQLWRFHTVPGNPADGFENDAMKMAAC